MNTLTYREYFNKVYGCWLGKCIAGNIGAPYEGMKQRLNLSYDPILLEKMLPNDDLDLQVLWLEILESRGLDFDSDDLAHIFLCAGRIRVFQEKLCGRHPSALKRKLQ